MQNFLRNVLAPFVRRFPCTVVLGTAFAGALAACAFAAEAKFAMTETRKSVAEIHTVTVTVSVTGTDANSRATADRIVQQVRALESVAVPAEQAQGWSWWR